MDRSEIHMLRLSRDQLFPFGYIHLCCPSNTVAIYIPITALREIIIIFHALHTPLISKTPPSAAYVLVEMAYSGCSPFKLTLIHSALQPLDLQKDG